LAKALEAAVDEGRLSRNPARRVVKPTRAEREVGYFTRAQMDALATAAAGTQLYVPVLIGSWMGMRRGEILGLRWADIDFAAGRLTVCRSLEETVAEGLRYKVPKTTKGTRTIGIPAPLLAALHEERRCQVKQRTEAAGSWHENDLVCCRWDGNPIRPSTVSSNFARLVTRLREADGSREKDERLDLPTCGFHGLRHGHGTELMRSGVQQRVVQERLGHEQLSTTSVYVHLAEDFDAEAVELLSTLHLRRTEQQLNNKEPRFPSGKRGQ
jgi:integrase